MPCPGNVIYMLRLNHMHHTAKCERKEISFLSTKQELFSDPIHQSKNIHICLTFIVVHLVSYGIKIK